MAHSPSLTHQNRLQWAHLATMPEQELVRVFDSGKIHRREIVRPWLIAVGGIFLFSETEDGLKSKYLALVTAWKQQNFDMVYNYIRKNDPLGIV